MRRFRILAVLGSSFLLLGSGVMRAQHHPAADTAAGSNTQSATAGGSGGAHRAIPRSAAQAQILVATTYPLEVVQAYQWQHITPVSPGQPSPTPRSSRTGTPACKLWSSFPTFSSA